MSATTQKQAFKLVLGRFQKVIDAGVDSYLSARGDKTELTQACAYALRGGKRFRPALVFLVAEALGRGYDVTPAALAIEFFHTSSLVADDLPCMDDDDERRGQPAVHKVYGEAVALLVTYALIAEGYHCLTQADSAIDAQARLVAIENVAWNTGIQGATGGQFLDLFPRDAKVETLHEVILKKTVSLFEIAFVLGWIFGGGDLQRLESVKAAARHYGMAFQIVDDFEDVGQDVENACQVNLVLALGREAAHEQVTQEILSYRHQLGELGVASASLLALADALEHKLASL